MAFSARSNGSWIANKCLLNMLECFCYDNDFYWPTNCNFLNGPIPASFVYFRLLHITQVNKSMKG